MSEQRVRIDMVGCVYGELTFIRFAHLDAKNNAHWWARCSCGVVKTVNGYDVRSGKIISCGHVKAATRAKNQTTHGHAQRGLSDRTYRCWCNMRARCYNESSGRYKNYGGRGIRVCDAWRESFETFLADMGEKPLGLTIERIDVNGNYEPSNCKWATWADQRINTTRGKHLTFNGLTMCLRDWAATTGLSSRTIAQRIRRGWPAERVLAIGDKPCRA